MIMALSSAAKAGVDVRIITPHIGDRWFVHAVTKSYYRTLIENGVRIYEYTPGFMHSKTFIADDEFGIIGTINMDYRSLYLHFECGVWLYKNSSILDMKDDFIETLDVCQEITLDELDKNEMVYQVFRLTIKSICSFDVKTKQLLSMIHIMIYDF